jgi:streptogramin lyase
MRRALFGLAATLFAALALTSSASTARAATVDGVFNLSGSPQRLAEGPDGNIWVTLAGSPTGEDIAKVTPAGVVTEFDSADYNNPIGITAGPDDKLWVTQAGGVASFDPSDPANPAKTPIAAVASAQTITVGPDGQLWTASDDKLISIPPANPAGANATTIPGMGARGISASAARLWIADFGGQRIVRANPGDPANPTFFATGGGPQETAASPDFGQIAFSNPTAVPQTIGRINPPADPLFTETPMRDPFGVTLGSDGKWWFAQFATNNLGRLTPDGRYTTLGGLPAASGPRHLTTGPNNTLWVGLQTTNQVARVTGVKAPPAPEPPQTTIDKATEKARAGKKGAEARFSFSASKPMATFECKLKRKGERNAIEQQLAEFGPCESPQRYSGLRKGQYTFAVRARVGGATDPSPAKAKLTVKRKKKR